MVFVQASTEKAFDSETGYIAINHIWGLINCNSGIPLLHSLELVQNWYKSSHVSLDTWLLSCHWALPYYAGDGLWEPEDV